MPTYPFAIVTDSVAELPLSLYDRYDIRMVPLHVSYEGHDWRDGIDITPSEFLDGVLDGCKELPRSSQPAPGDWLAAYEGLVAEGYTQIISLHLPAAVSGTVETAAACAAQVVEAHPGVRIEVMDTYTATIGEGVAVLDVALLREDGGSLDDAVALIDNLRTTERFLFVPDTLDNLVKGGRLSRLAGMAASVLDIKPVIQTTEVCSMIVPAKVRGMRKALTRVAGFMAERASEVGPLAFFRLNAHASAQTRSLLDTLVVDPLVAAGNVCLGTATIGPVIATHIGLGATGVYSFARKYVNPRLAEVLATFVPDPVPAVHPDASGTLA